MNKELKEFTNEEFLQELDQRIEAKKINLDLLITVLQKKQQLSKNHE